MTTCSTYTSVDAAVAHGGCVLSQHLELHPEIKIVPLLVFVEAQQGDGNHDSARLAVVDGGAPGGSAPGAPYLGPAQLGQLQRAVRTAFPRKRHKTPHGEAVEC